MPFLKSCAYSAIKATINISYCTLIPDLRRSFIHQARLLKLYKLLQVLSVNKRSQVNSFKKLKTYAKVRLCSQSSCQAAQITWLHLCLHFPHECRWRASHRNKRRKRRKEKVCNKKRARKKRPRKKQFRLQLVRPSMNRRTWREANGLCTLSLPMKTARESKALSRLESGQ